MPEAGILTINDLLAGKNLAGGAQEDLATQTLRSKKAEVKSKKLQVHPVKYRHSGNFAKSEIISQGKNQNPIAAPTQFRDIPTSAQNLPLPSPPLSKGREEDNDDFSPLTRGRLGGGQEEEQAAGQSLREQVMQAKAKEQKDKLQESKGADAQAGAEGAGKKFGTSMLLKMSWLNLIDTFGLTLIYINIHVFLRWVLGEKFFCKLGEEWVPKEAEAAAGEAGKTVSKSAGIVEAGGLILLDIMAGAIIISVLGLIVMIVTWMGMSWWGKLATIFTAIWNLGFGAITVLVELFGG